VLPLRNTDYTDYALLGLALAYVLSNVVNVVHAWWRLKHSKLVMPHVTGRQLLRAGLASIVGATWAYIAFAELPHPMPGGQVARLAIAGVLGLLPVVVLEILPPLLRHRAAGKERRAEAKKVKQAEAEEARAAARVVTRHVRPIHPAFVAVVVVAAATGGTLTALAFVQGWGMIATVAPAGLLVGAGLFSLAMGRFEMFVLALLVTRTSLDALKFGGENAVLDPAALLGMLFLGAGVIWLLAQWREEERLRFSPLSWAVVGFAGAALLGTIVAPAYGPAFVEWTRLASVCVMFLVVERAAVRGIFRSQIVAVVMLASVLPLAVAAYQIKSGADLFDAGGFGRATGTFTHSNPMAAFMALVVVMAFAHVVHSDNRRVQVWCGVAMAAASVGLFVTYTRAAWLAAILGILVVAGAKGRRWVGAAAAVLLIVLLTVPGATSRFSDLSDETTSRGEPSNSLSWRVEYWAEALDLAHASPVTGIGLKQVATQSEEGKQPHNDFLRAYVEMGVVGLAAYLWMIWQFINTGRRAARVTRDGPARDRAFAIGFGGCAAGYVLMCLVANLMSQVVVGVYFVAFAGGAAAIVTARNGWRDEKSDDEDQDEDEEVGAECASST
jgi:O-antigen ligase